MKANNLINFTLDGERDFEGYETANTWNGFDCPVFDLSTCRDILTYLKDEKQINDFDINKYSIKVIDINGELEEYDIQNGLCALGSFGWCWMKSEEN